MYFRNIAEWVCYRYHCIVQRGYKALFKSKQALVTKAV